MNRFTEKTAIVTGGTSGIGRASAIRLVQEGARVIVTGRNEKRLAELDAMAGIAAVANDSSKPEDANALRHLVDTHFEGKLDALYLNAGLGAFQPLQELSSEEIDRQFHINVRGPLLQLRALEPVLRDGSAVLVTSSVVTWLGMPGSSIYSGTKGAIRAAMRVFANELAGRGIRVNTINPGPIETGFLDELGMSEEQMQEMAEQIQQQVALGRFGRAEEIAAAAAFLLSTDASYVTGAELVVDGGMT